MAQAVGGFFYKGISLFLWKVTIDGGIIGWYNECANKVNNN